jgi:4-hydroxybenzoate polyprenyltransferase
MLDWLRLIRASGMFTIASNSLAAVLVMASGDDLWLHGLLGRLHTAGTHLLWIPLASFCLYASGMLWNDVHDVDRDRALNPRRPLPSGRISLATAYVAGVLLSLGALICGFLAEGKVGFHAAGVVLTLALLYDFVAKDVPYLGSLVMGLVRASHAVFALLILGQDSGYFSMQLLLRSEPHQPVVLAYPLILGLYIFGLTLISELESRRARRWELLFGGAIVAGAIALAVARVADAHWIKLLWHRTAAGPVGVGIALAFALAVLLWLLALIGRPYLEALRSGKQAMVGATVFAGLGGMILLDAVVASSAHPLGGLVVAALFPVFRGVGALIRMD